MTGSHFHGITSSIAVFVFQFSLDPIAGKKQTNDIAGTRYLE